LCMSGTTVVKSDDTVDSVLLFGCGARIESGARVRKDVVSFGGNVVLEQGTRVEGDVVVFGGNVSIAGEVRQDVTVFGGNVTLAPTAVVGSNLITFGGFVDRKEGATVRGRITRGERFYFPFEWTPVMMPFAFGGSALGMLTGMAAGFVRGIFYALALAALGALVVVFLPTQTRQVSDTAYKSAMPSLGVGCLTLFVAVTLGILLIITLCGIPIALILFVALFIAWLFGWIALGWLIGEKVLAAAKVKETLSVPIVAVVVGIVLLAILGALPLAGWLIGLFVGSLGLGAVVLTRFGTRAYPLLASAAVPVVPAAPVAPVAPVAPAAPVAPVAPAAPVAPVAPVTPDAPAAPDQSTPPSSSDASASG